MSHAATPISCSSHARLKSAGVIPLYPFKKATCNSNWRSLIITSYNRSACME